MCRPLEIHNLQFLSGACCLSQVLGGSPGNYTLDTLHLYKIPGWPVYLCIPNGKYNNYFCSLENLLWDMYFNNSFNCILEKGTTIVAGNLEIVSVVALTLSSFLPWWCWWNIAMVVVRRRTMLFEVWFHWDCIACPFILKQGEKSPPRLWFFLPVPANKKKSPWFWWNFLCMWKFGFSCPHNNEKYPETADLYQVNYIFGKITTFTGMVGKTLITTYQYFQESPH